ncbi:hypothetical protein ACFQPA_00980 [Halomarina halobia]|uniref:Uncharacterized protein n=1 Tax=Halomarina halobia TaxID=3033386 RepID=A0ABD6A875_9EURY|nr:hypothetical protein [Halomarina sp. PSR21]
MNRPKAVGPLIVEVSDEQAFLAWSLLPPVGYAADPSFAAHPSAIEPTPAFLLELGLFAAAGLRVRDGCPGVREPLIALVERFRPPDE